MTFGEAVEAVKNGARAQREGWNGKDQYVELASEISYVNARGEIVNADHEAIGNQALAFVGTSGVQLGWLASQADMLACDWKLIEAVEDEVDLRCLEAGDRFTWKGYDWICLDPAYVKSDVSGVFALMDGLYKEEVPFNTSEHVKETGRPLNNYAYSTLRHECDSLAEELGTENLFLHEVDLTSDDGMDDYGTVYGRVFPLSCEEYRRYRKLIPLYDDWWWTCTPYSCYPSYASGARIVCTDGSLYYYNATNGNGLVPACIICKDLS